MSFDDFHPTIVEKDTVVLFLGKSNLQLIEVTKDKVHQTKHGAFPHNQLVGKKFGSKIYSQTGRGWIYVLYPTPELWTACLPHRTQILYTTDISMVITELEIRPGSVVVESGTGSGSLSHSLLRALKPAGHLYTFDFHEQRSEKAREEFETHGLSSFVTSQHRDVLADGFGLEDVADAVFLDLPAPYDAVTHAKKALKKSGGRLCSFSPCIEQVQETCNVLRQHRFCDIKTVECLLRTINVRNSLMPEARLTNQDDIKYNKAADSDAQQKAADNDAKEQPEGKKIKLEDPAEAEDQVDAGDKEKEDKSKEEAEVKPMKHKLPTNRGNVEYLASAPKKEMPGHTGYLTFASLYPTL